MPSERGLEALFKGIGAGGILTLVGVAVTLLALFVKLYFWREGIVRKECEEKVQATLDRVEDLENHQKETNIHREKVHEDLTILKERGEFTGRMLAKLETSVDALHKRLDHTGTPRA